MVFKPQTFHELPPQSELDDPTDARLEAEVADAIARSAALDASRITVTASGATIALSGYVGSREEIDMAVETAARIEGVSHVESSLGVQAGAG